MGTRKLEHFFLAAFVLELGMRAIAEGRASWKSGWFRFDSILVAIGVMSTWGIEPIVLNHMSQDGSLFLDILSQVLILRILRLLRLVRAVRLFEQFQEMWK